MHNELGYNGIFLLRVLMLTGYCAMRAFLRLYVLIVLFVFVCRRPMLTRKWLASGRGNGPKSSAHSLLSLVISLSSLVSRSSRSVPGQNYSPTCQSSTSNTIAPQNPQGPTQTSDHPQETSLRQTIDGCTCTIVASAGAGCLLMVVVGHGGAGGCVLDAGRTLAKKTTPRDACSDKTFASLILSSVIGRMCAELGGWTGPKKCC